MTTSGSFIIKPLNEAPKFLGGIPDGDGTSKVDPSSEVGKMPRPQNLPPFQGIKKVKAEKRDEFLALWEGEFQVDWEMSLTEDKFNCVAGILIIHDDNSNEANDCAVLSVSFSCDLANDEQSCVDFPLFYDEGFKCAMTEKTQKALSCRIWHRILRSEGARLPFPWPAFKILCSFLVEYYNDQAYYMEALDVRILMVDVALNLRMDDRDAIAQNLRCCANLLETQGHFEQAAFLFKELAFQYSADDRDRYVFWKFAGFACECYGNWKSAEECYFKALHYNIEISGGNWMINDKWSIEILEHLLFTYSELAIVDQAEQTAFALSSLVFVAGMKNCRQGSNFWFYLDTGESYHRLLKRGLQSAKKAKRALVTAASALDVNTFRERLVACFDPNKRVPNDFFGREPYCCLTSNREHGLNTARDFAKTETPRIEAAYVTCNNTECGKKQSDRDGKAFMICPCKSAIYCSKDCQRAHFAIHKQYCKKVAKDLKKSNEAAGAAKNESSS